MSRRPVISSSLRNRRIRGTAPAEPPPAVHDLIVTGTLNPDSTGFYDDAGVHNGQAYYERADSAWFIWFEFDPFGPFWTWFISATLGVKGPAYWNDEEFAPHDELGTYLPTLAATGQATVATPP